MGDEGTLAQIFEQGDDALTIEPNDWVHCYVMFGLKKKFLLFNKSQLDRPSKKTEKQNVDPKAEANNITKSNEKEAHKQLTGEKKETEEKSSKEKREQRVKFISLLFI